jgi:hypothetical protein
MRKLRAILSFLRHQQWVDEPRWTEEDGKALTSFLQTPAGRRLSRILLNLTVRQNSSAVQKKPDALAQACGYAMGFRGAVATIESLCSTTNSPGAFDDSSVADEPIVD